MWADGFCQDRVDSTTVPLIQVSDLMALHAKLGKCLGSFEVGNGGEFKALDWWKKLIIAPYAAIGMEYLHLKKSIHFDLKCENLLVGDFGRCVLIWHCNVEILTEEPYADMHCGAIIDDDQNDSISVPLFVSAVLSPTSSSAQFHWCSRAASFDSIEKLFSLLDNSTYLLTAFPFDINVFFDNPILVRNIILTSLHTDKEETINDEEEFYKGNVVFDAGLHESNVDEPSVFQFSKTASNCLNIAEMAGLTPGQEICIQNLEGTEYLMQVRKEKSRTYERYAVTGWADFMRSNGFCFKLFGGLFFELCYSDVNYDFTDPFKGDCEQYAAAYQCDERWKALVEDCWSHDRADMPTFTEITNKLQVMSMALPSKRHNNNAKDLMVYDGRMNRKVSHSL
ncbi:hypothetical protein L1987_33271 [Smallanthus sonchifolius]|uniref:Uncharacterized protein n=1 Tax=Smallanthus sonchifolius TaxID=185202 RepID=A0ACB9HS94_9ASTR|nr:hypothetical protein L1987_33271 [Smallanthus sonchifolius]